MKKTLFVFDIDDTLTVSAKLHQEAFLLSMKNFDFIDIDTNWGGYLHHTDSYIFRKNYEKNKSIPFSNSLIETFETGILKYLKLNAVAEVRGAAHFIASLREQGYAVCFATGSLEKPAFLKLEKIGIPFSPELVVASNTLESREEIVSQAITNAERFYDMTFESVISVGDGLWDLKTARNLGIDFIAIGPRNKAVLLKKGTKFHADNWLNFNLDDALMNLGLLTG